MFTLKKQVESYEYCIKRNLGKTEQ